MTGKKTAIQDQRLLSSLEGEIQMIVLHQFAPAFGMPNFSTFCMKVETYLRLVNLPYEVKIVANPSKAPKGKLPFITDEDQTVCDSEHILAYLKERYGDPLGEGLSEESRADHLLLKRMIEEHLYFAVVQTRWLREGNSDLVKEAGFSAVPSLMRGIVFKMVQKSLRKALVGHGIARHTDEEIDAFAVEDIRALGAKLGETAFFGGDSPREIDCTVWAMIANILGTPFVTPMQDCAKACPNLVSYNERMWEQAFPEYKR